MENRPEGGVRYVIERSMAGRWDVNQHGFDEPIASFEARADALEYALRLADTKTDAQVRVRHWLRSRRKITLNTGNLYTHRLA